jgi:hypothetical protein
VLFGNSGVGGGVAGVGGGLVVVVAPFCKVVCEFEAGGVGIGVFEINDYELFVLVGRMEER